MKRRDLFKLGGAFLLTANAKSNSFVNNALNDKSKITISKDEWIQDTKGSVDSDRLIKVLDNGIQAQFNVDAVVEGWKQIIKPHQVVGLKVNCLSGYGSTHTELIDAIIERLREAGLKSRNIIIWDRLNSDLEDAGFKISYDGSGPKCYGNDYAGFEPNLEIFGSAASRVTRTVTRHCDVIINLPLLKDHSIAGVTLSMKNLFGAIHNPHKYHLNVGDPYIADVNMLPSIRNKVRLNICDAINAQYEGGPSFMPQWRWPFNGLIFGTDRVALDYTGWQIIEEKRKAMGKKSLTESGRKPSYIATAADPDHMLGTNKPENIEVIQI